MEGYYEVRFENRSVGKVQLLKEGLYYRFICRCRFQALEIHRLVMVCSEKQINIGVVVPEGDGYALDKKIPAKLICAGTPYFYLAPKHESVHGKFVPICPEEPFAYIERLKDSFLVRQNGQIGVWIPE